MKRIIVEFSKKELSKFVNSNNSIVEYTSKLDSKLIVEFGKEEKKSIESLLNKNDQFEFLRVELPGYVNVNDIITDKIINEGSSKIKITIRESSKQKEPFLEYI